MRTCTGCRQVVPQQDLVRVSVFSDLSSDRPGDLIAVDPRRRLPGRGAYVHARAACVTVQGLARGLRRSVTPREVQRIASELSLLGDNSRAIRQSVQSPSLAGTDAVERPPRSER